MTRLAQHGFWASRPLIGMVHLRALPGSARGSDMSGALQAAEADAIALRDGGADAIMVENFFDAPFTRAAISPAAIAGITRAACLVKEASGLPIGINALRNDGPAAVAIAHVVGAEFVRVNVFTGAAVTDQGIIQGAALETVMARRHLAADVEIWADVFVKHASPLGDANLAETARDSVERGLADALIITGIATGAPASAGDAAEVKGACPHARLLLGSGFSASIDQELMRWVDGVIVGTACKMDGRVDAPVDRDRVRALRDCLSSAAERQTLAPPSGMHA